MPPRRKQKQPEYEDDPVITTPQVPLYSDSETTRVTVEPSRHKLIVDNEPKDLPIVGDNTAKSKGFDELLDKVANKYHDPMVISPPKVVENTPKTPVKPSVSEGKPINFERKVTEPMSETVEGWGKVLGRKEKDVKTT